MNLERSLPADMRGATTTIAKVSAGLSGAGVYRVEVDGRTFVLKVAHEGDSLAVWHSKLHVQQLAAEAGLAPRIVHVDEATRAVLSEFVVDRSFSMFYFDPRTRDAALAMLGRTVRRVHELQVPPGRTLKDPLDFFNDLWSGLVHSFALPDFVGDTVRHVLAEKAPVRERPLVLSHNDANPSNLIYDGEHLLLLDWESAGANDPFYDLATIAVFLRMDVATCQGLLAAYDGERVEMLPARFVYTQRLVAALCGTMFLRLARNAGHPGASGTETLDSTPSLGECYQRFRAGALNVAGADGQWMFGLALIKESLALEEGA